DVEVGDEEPEAHDPQRKHLAPGREPGGRLEFRRCGNRARRSACPLIDQRDGTHRRASRVAFVPFGRSDTRATTERPGRNVASSATLPSSRIRTGTRWTILVKLPVAFSGGITLNWAPVAGARLATTPDKVMPGRASAVISTDWRARMWAS